MIATPANIIPVNGESGSGPGLPVVLYLRKSNKTSGKSRDETVSIQQQRADLRAWCEQRGWIIVGEYVDDGRSASKNEKKRIQFARLLKDIETADFRAVVVWDLSRLTRKNSVDSKDAAKVLMANRILVESLRDGEINLTTSVGRTLWTLHTEGNSEFALKVSGGTIRGRDHSLRRGNWPHGKVPYGYRRQYWDGETLVKEMHRNEKAGKARHWATKIVPDPEESKYAVQIISGIANRDISIRGMAIEMTKIGAPTMNGSPWIAEQVKDIIRCPAYVGDTGIGYSNGWKRSVAGIGYEAHAHSERQINEEACASIIDRPTWERANQKLDATQNGRRVHAGKSSPLSGIVYCGHCNKSMAKNVKRGVTRFVCATASKNSESATCRQWTVQERDLLPIFQKQLAEAVDFELLNSLAARPPEQDTAQLAVLERQEADLAKQVAKAAKNLALCDSGFEEVQAVLTELKSDLDRVQNTAHLIRSAADKTELQRAADWWRSQRSRLIYVKIPKAREAEAFKNWGVINSHRAADGRLVDAKAVIPATDDMFRDLLKRLNARITLHFTPKAKGPGAKKQYYAIEWGRLQATLGGHSFDASRLANTWVRAARR